jgi:hypothetical protein
LNASGVDSDTAEPVLALKSNKRKAENVVEFVASDDDPEDQPKKKVVSIKYALVLLLALFVVITS